MIDIGSGINIGTGIVIGNVSAITTYFITEITLEDLITEDDQNLITEN